MAKREQILQRLKTVLETVPNVTLVRRNTVDIPESQVPALVLLDGDEAPLDEEAFGKSRGPRSPILMQMDPEIYILLIANPDDVGTAMNDMLANIVHAVSTDQVLEQLSHDGDIRYGGAQTALALGRSLTGEAGVTFSITYVLYPGSQD